MEHQLEPTLTVVMVEQSFWFGGCWGVGFKQTLENSEFHQRAHQYQFVVLG